MAGAKAKKIEAATLALNTSKWKVAIGASSCEGKGPMPCRLAHGWVKGIEGWTASTVAPNSWHDEVAVEEGAHAREAEFHLEGRCGADFLIPLSDQAVFDKEAADGAIIWQDLRRPHV